MREESPCLDCKARHPNCHANCQDFADWSKRDKERTQKVKAELKEAARNSWNEFDRFKYWG